MLPQTAQPLGVSEDKTRVALKKLILDNVDDEYLRVECSRVLLSNPKWGPRRNAS